MKHPLFPVLLAVYPVLYMASVNPGQAGTVAVLTASVAIAIGSLAVVGLFRMAFDSWHRAATGTLLVLLLFYIYGPVHSRLELRLLDSLTGTAPRDIYLQMAAPHLHLLLSALWIVTAVVGCAAIRRATPRSLVALTAALNVSAAILLGLLGISWVANAAIRDTSDDDPPSPVSQHQSASTIGYEPDIYLIVLDGYARSDVLREYYQFDNAAFLHGLRNRGFQISDDSHANYNWTFLSLASLLNMDYVLNIVGKAASSRAAVYESIRNNSFATLLRDRGYTIVHLQSTWGATLHNSYADVELQCHRGIFTNDFYRLVVEASWLKILQSRMNDNLANCYLNNFQTLENIGSQPGPKFVFAHFLPPHHPYLFDRKGRVLRNATLSDQFEFQKRLWEQKQPYLDQLMYVNRRISSALDRILLDSAQPPVIIIQSDHGPNFDVGLSRAEKIHVRLSNLAAHLLPQAPADLLPDNGSSVNQFRRLSNFYFRSEFDVLPDRYYFSDYLTPFEVADVTDVVDGLPRAERPR